MQNFHPNNKSCCANHWKKSRPSAPEMLAAQNQCSFEDVIRRLPENCIRQTEGSRIVEILQAVAAWNEAVTFIAHTPDAIVEVTGNCPAAKSAAASTISTIPKPTAAYTVISIMKTAPPSTF